MASMGELMLKAKESAMLAYAPYSDYKVGAALETEDGQIISGCNIENASLGLAVCAERVAIFKAVSEGKKPVKIAIWTDKGAPPCGACRQVMYEHNPDMIIVYGNDAGYKGKQLSELLPYAFSRQ